MKILQMIPLFFCALPVIAADTIEIQSSITLTTATKAHLKAFRDVVTESGTQVATQVDDYKLTLVPTHATGGRIRIESVFTEHASAANAKAVKLPAVSGTSGKKSSVVMGSYTFEFVPTLRKER